VEERCCQHCQGSFVQHRRQQTYCGKLCQRRAASLRHRLAQGERYLEQARRYYAAQSRERRDKDRERARCRADRARAQINAGKRARYWKNVEAERAKKRVVRRRNQSRNTEYACTYRAKHPDRIAEAKRRHRQARHQLRLLAALGSLTEENAQ
jgi:hypothetical protein